MGNDSDDLHLSRSATIGPKSAIRGDIIRCATSLTVCYGAGLFGELG